MFLTKTSSLVVRLNHTFVDGPFSAHLRFLAQFSHSSKKQFRKRGRSVNASFVQNKTSTNSFIDDEPYYDPDFEYTDHCMSSNKKRLISIRSSRSIPKHQHRNVLYQTDEDDIKLAKQKRNDIYANKNICQLHKRFEIEQVAKQNFGDSENTCYKNEAIKDTIIKKINSRTLIPLPFEITESNRFDILNQNVIPLYNTPYAIQLKKKYEENMNTLCYFGEKLRRMESPVRLLRNGLPCTLEPVRASPRIAQYRNKDEFNIGPGIDRNTKTVGFFVGKQSLHRDCIIVEPDQMIISKQSHIDLAKRFQRYLRDVSPYDYCQNYGLEGHWRRIHIRSNEANDMMMSVHMHPQQLKDYQLQQEMDRVRDYFRDEPSLKSLYFQATRHTRSTHTDEPYLLLSGDSTISERLFDQRFVISPNSFFQVNTAAAEVLYRVIMTEVISKRKTTVLDLCCGTGTLSILLSGHVKQVIGIDSSESSINDAKRNAAVNDIHNITFLNGTLEDILPKLTESHRFSGNVIAIVNPSRRALHPKVVHTLRQMDFIEKLIYVSCKPDGDALRNFVQLCQLNSEASSSQFVPINAVPVDLFPHTLHCELVLTFERF